MDFAKLFENILREPAKRNFYSPIPDENVMDEGFSPQLFEPEKSYFEIRLAEMFLKDQREYWREFIPLSIVVSDFIYGGSPDRQTVPFFAGNELLKEIRDYVKGEHVELYNTRVAGPVPYMGSGLSLFVGLFRVQVNDLVRNLLNLVQTLVNSFNPAVLSTYMDIAKSLSSGLPALLGMKEVELRLGARDEFGTSVSDPRKFKDGYLVYINSPEATVDISTLRVKDGRLHVISGTGSTRPFTDQDFCLMRITRLLEREDYTTLPFHRLWKEAKDRVWRGEEEKGRRAFLDLLHQVAVSPDLTTGHQNSLIQAYVANFENELARYKTVAGIGVGPGRGAERGAGGIAEARTYIRIAAGRAKNASLSEHVVDDLLHISENWDAIPFLTERPDKFELTDQVLTKQIKTFETLRVSARPDPKALADAITLSAFKVV